MRSQIRVTDNTLLFAVCFDLKFVEIFSFKEFLTNININLVNEPTLDFGSDVLAINVDVM